MKLEYIQNLPDRWLRKEKKDWKLFFFLLAIVLLSSVQL